MLLTGSNLKDIQDVKKILKSKFDMKDLGQARKILGMNIQRDRNKFKLFLNQNGYIKKISNKFSMDKAKLASIPFGSQYKLSSD